MKGNGGNQDRIVKRQGAKDSSEGQRGSIDEEMDRGPTTTAKRMIKIKILNRPKRGKIAQQERRKVRPLTT